ncbi:MAG TPA: fibronectin type III domain-containing protein, partial [Firmicutes bacterium]|nr:fibronectin type III domain-containing protein [Bacillota bacterium]
QEPDSERPEAPTDFTANVQENIILLEWNYPEDDQDLKSFSLFRQKNGEERQFVASIYPGYTSYSDAIYDSPGTEYIYTLFATDRHDHYSLPVEVKIKLGGKEETTRPQKPSAFHGNYLDNAVVLTWVDPGAADSFILERKKTPGSFAVLATIPGNQASFQDTELQPGTTYYYRIYALKNGATSKPAEVKIFVPPREGEYDQPDDD